MATGSVIDWGAGVDAAFAHLGPVSVVADVRAAALAEARLGAGRGRSVMVYVRVGTGIATLVNLLDPEIVVVGGGLGSAGGRYLDGAILAARPRIWLPPARDLPIVTADLGPDAGVVGAALAGRVAG